MPQVQSISNVKPFQQDSTGADNSEASSFVDDCIVHDTADTRVTASTAVNRVRYATSVVYNRMARIWAIGR